MSIAESLRSATYVNAEILNQSGQIGVIAPGALADLIVVDGDPLADPTLLESQGRHLSVIMQGGGSTSGRCPKASRSTTTA